MLGTLVHHPAVSHWLRFAATTVGRDKALRLLQYVARFLSWYMLHKGYTASAIAPWDAIKKNFGSVRKALRIGKNIEHLKAASVALESKSLPPVLRYLTVARQLSYFGYLTLDTIGYLASQRIVTLSSPLATARVVRESQRLWLSGIAFSLCHSVLQLQALRQRQLHAVKTEAEGRLAADQLRRERAAVQTQLLLDGCDLLIPASALGYLRLDDGLVGAAGAVSSWIGLKAAWAKSA